MRHSSAKRSSRGFVKHSPPIPYTASSPFFTDVGKPRGLQARKVLGLVSRLKSAVLQKLLPIYHPPINYGDILREVPYYVQTRVVAFFSIHPSYCEDVFGVSHGQCIRFTRGPWMNETAIIVGVRGGKLWIVGCDGPVVARPLREVQKHGWEKVRPEATLLGRFREGLVGARKDVELDYSPEQREFLQKAPDLYAEVVDDEVAGGEEIDPVEVGWDGPTAGSRGESGGVAPSDGVASCIPPNNGRTGNTNNDTRIGEFSTARKRIVLVPELLQSTNDLGWAGEGLVTVNGGGVKSFSASLSASVLL
ncbi:hypothetical protein TcG_04400 [Trypanosoma cruzi]|uniref:Uncharacterized protein n=1 Tax=Trypanosoma cruzi TaxID=5693 RepID=A0A2V2UVW4_TRYCR|nr:hypothetical protein BCY84_17633 [Trypanosoma cruzi cruzi]PWU87292.1 hypothetical protein C4B63_95g14 [Trypanosoma cruzi]RNF19040.1 hypothetical protein TcG_04400 [Trypanosoma cruzi]